MALTREFDVLVIGAGPAGLAAAWAASLGKVRVGLVDDNPGPGGQIWRGDAKQEWVGRVRRASNIEVLPGTSVVGPVELGELLAEQNGALRLRYQKLILATGARERFLPFPGWTLPNVMGAGGLQALVKGGLAIRGKRIAIAGTGPLLVAVAATLKDKGAHIVLVAEQTRAAMLRAFAAALPFPKLLMGAWLRWRLMSTPYFTDAWPLRAEGSERLETVVFQVNGKERREPLDFLGCGFGLAGNTELAAVLGCPIGQGGVTVDRWQQTAVAGIYCAGETVGVGGLDVALLEGQIAGFAAAGHETSAEGLLAERDQAAEFRKLLERCFALRPELKKLATPDTLVCRCEDVALKQLAGFDGWRAAKLQTRCGMGPCQGRVCGHAAEFLLGWTPESVRPPVLPISVATLAAE